MANIRADFLPAGWTVDDPYPNGVQVISAPNNRGMISIDPRNRIWQLGGTMHPRWADYLTARTYKGRGWLKALVNDAIAALEAAWA